ncbi:polysaccharide deacetylase family protein [Croceibacterium sp. LX-88]|uniref:Chitooligosaccharide deacetylase n=1 Tax=Croceibacterium selenioxidans TaxID=2838833 RepID=A0ABS5W5Q5_9SPHN|nr:polysaccharide deacetylase family protein [Croceibacterium selenioxidans]
MAGLLRLLLAVATLALGAAAVPALAQEGKRIAISFDDVPRHPGGFMTPDQRTAALITGLAQAGVEQAGFFVTTGNLDTDFGKGGEERIRAYVAAGHVIGNHSHSHTWLSQNTAADYVSDLDRAEAWLAGKPGKRPWYRFPYLDEGRDLARRDALRTALRERGLMNAYVTIDDYDWAIDDLARKAVEAKRPIDRDALRDLYVETIVGTADFYDAMARETLGRQPAHVLLLHETDLAGLFIVDLIKGLRAAGWTIVTLDEAYRDPIAQTEPDTLYLGGGRLAALAHVAGKNPKSLVYERTNEAVLEKLFEERVIVRGAR